MMRARFVLRVVAILVAWLAIAVIVGCGGKKVPVPAPTVVKIVETVEVKVPVPIKAAPPTELLTPLTPPLPVFLSPADPKSSSALSVEGERLLRALLEELLARIRAWEAWATAP
jgi:hypothetical protein